MSNHSIQIGDTMYLRFLPGSANAIPVVVVGYVFKNEMSDRSQDFISIVSALSPFTGTQLTVHYSVLKKNQTGELV